MHVAVVLTALTLAATACGRVGFDARNADAGAAAATSFFYQAAMTSTPLAVPIEPVDPARTMVVCDYRTSSSIHTRMPTCELADPTTLIFETGVADPDVVVHAQVIELAGAFVQRGTKRLGSNDAISDPPVTIQPVDLGTSFAIMTRRGYLTADGFDERFAVTASLVDPTHLELRRNDTGNTLDVVWQVVQLDGAFVSSGTSTIADGAGIANVTVTAVDPARAFVIASSRGGNGYEVDSLVRAHLGDSTTLALSRESTSTTVDVSWFVVEQRDVVVQHGETAMTTRPTVSQPISLVDRSRAGAFVSVSGGLAADNTQSDAAFCATTLSPTALELTRGDSTDINGVVSWSVVEWTGVGGGR